MTWDNADFCEEMRCPKLFKHEACGGDDCVFIEIRRGIQIFFAPEGSDKAFWVTTINKESKQ